MESILVFRIFLLLFFLFLIYKFGDWKSLKLYYPSMLFMGFVNNIASFLTYHHWLWYYNPDILVKTQTTVELLNSLYALPITAFVYLSNFPRNKLKQCLYVLLWVSIFGILELIDHVLGGISYSNGWSWEISLIFDVAMFLIVGLHHFYPLKAWIITIFLTIIILTIFNISSAEIK
jgi:hypothetical protein